MIIYSTMKKANRKTKRRCKTIEDKREQWWLESLLETKMKAVDRDYMNRNSIREER